MSTSDEETAARLLGQAEDLLQQARSFCSRSLMDAREVADVHARVALARELRELAGYRTY